MRVLSLLKRNHGVTLTIVSRGRLRPRSRRWEK
jgi:hypothetical protein